MASVAANAAGKAATSAASSWLSRGMKVALGGWTAFGTSHVVLAHDPIREKLIETCGSVTNYRILYGAVAVATLAPMMAMFYRTPAAMRGPIMHNLAKDKKSLSYAVMATLKGLGAFMVTDAYMTPVPNPLSILTLDSGEEPTDPRKIQRKYQVYGLQRITRHSEFLGIGLYALGSMLSGRRLAELVLWGITPLFAIAGAKHQEMRLRKTKPQRYFDETSFWPFGAIIDGRQSMGKVMVEVPAAAYASCFVVMGTLFFY